MGYAFSFSELASDLGTNTADGMRNIANQAANFACNAYSQYAGATANWSDPTGIGAFNNALYSRLCGPRGKNPPQGNSSYSGGQCNVLYNITVQNTAYDGTMSVSQLFNIPGPVNGIVKRVRSFPSMKYDIIVPNYQGPPVGYYEVGSVDSRDEGQYKRTILSVVRKDGQPDNCGNYPYPYPILPIPNTSYTNQNNVTINVGGGAVINGNLILIPTIIKANAFIYPQIKVGIGPFTVGFDLGGVTISPNFNFTSDNQSPNGTNLPPGSPSGQNRDTQNDPCSTTIPPTDLTPVLTKLTTLQNTSNDIKDCSCPVNYSVNTVALGSGIAGYAALPSNSIKVNMTITQSPSNAKTQKSYGTEPENYFCGYYYWGDGTGRTERIAVSTLQSVFYKPDWATAFGWNLYLGYNCSVTASYLQPEKAGSQIATVQMKKAPS